MHYLILSGTEEEEVSELCVFVTSWNIKGVAVGTYVIINAPFLTIPML